MQELAKDEAMLVLVRHGQSEWNFANRFIGWYDSPLTEEGEWEATEAGQLLAAHSIEVDEVHTSMLTRVLSTAKEALGVMREGGLKVPPFEDVQSTWRLNERSYGALTGRNKKECSKEFGKDQLKIWRRSWDIPPPQYEHGCDLYAAETEAFRQKVDDLQKSGLYDAKRDPPPEHLPRGESLKDTLERLVPYWENILLPSLQAGKRVMVFGHENNLRALLKLMDDLNEEQILEVDIPRAMPMVYFFKKNEVLQSSHGSYPRLQPVRLTPDDAAEGSQYISARYLVDAELIAAFHKRDVMNVYDTSIEDNLEEACIIDPEDPEKSAMCETIDEYQQHENDDFAAGVVDIQKELVAAGAAPGAGKAPSDAAFVSLPWGSPASASMRSTATAATAGAASGSNFSCPSVGSAAFAVLAIMQGVLSARRRLLRRPHNAVATHARWAPSGNITLLRAVSDEAVANAANEDKCVGPSMCSAAERAEAAAMRRAWEDSYSQILDGGYAGEGSDIYMGPEEDEEDADADMEEICELLGYDFGENLKHQIGRDFTEAERLAARRAAGYDGANSTAAPQAIWLIGPSASGKSTLAPRAAGWSGMLSDGGGYVLVDGEMFRDSHQGYQAALQEGHNMGCVWWGAYTTIRENVNKEKQAMLRDAVQASKNLVIPSTCLRRSQCVDVAAMLLESGYKVHIVGIYGEKEEIVRRGRKRAMEKGKRYDPREFVLALRQFAPMLRLCNGKYWMVCTTSDSPYDPTDEGVGPLSEGNVQDVCGRVFGVFAGAQDVSIEA